MAKKKKSVLAMIFAGAAMGAAALPTVTDVAVTQTPTRRVQVSYKLSSAEPGDAAVVTVEFLTNGVKLADSCVRTLTGDVSRVIPADGETKTLWWHPRQDWPDNFVPEGFAARVVAWATNAPPQVMVLDLKLQKGVLFYPSFDSLPEEGGIQNAVYKTDKMAFRRIPAGGVTFRMGAPRETGNDSRYQSETLHNVQFNEDYYMAVYPITQRQYLWILQENGVTHNLPYNCGFTDKTEHPLCDQYPCGGLSYDHLRNSGAAIAWPRGGHKNVGQWTIAGRMRTKFGVEIDIPTEAQWEYACRAGTETSLNTGVNLSDGSACPEMDAAGWYSGNCGGTLHPVGLKAPNAWGLYDMHGMVSEVVLDWYDAGYYGTLPADEPVVDPRGPATAAKRVMRGGNFTLQAMYCRSASRLDISENGCWNAIGGRLCCPGFVWVMSDDELPAE